MRDTRAVKVFTLGHGVLIYEVGCGYRGIGCGLSSGSLPGAVPILARP